MKLNDRIRGYASQIGVSTIGGFKNETTKRKLVAKLTPAQRRRLRKKIAVT